MFEWDHTGPLCCPTVSVGLTEGACVCVCLFFRKYKHSIKGGGSSHSHDVCDWVGNSLPALEPSVCLHVCQCVFTSRGTGWVRCVNCSLGSSPIHTLPASMNTWREQHWVTRKRRNMTPTRLNQFFSLVKVKFWEIHLFAFLQRVNLSVVSLAPSTKTGNKSG